MVRMPSFFSVSTLEPPAMYSSRTGRGHIFTLISSGKRVWTLSGFSKSEAILASSLLEEIPILTVNPNFSRTLSLISKAADT